MEKQQQQKAFLTLKWDPPDNPAHIYQARAFNPSAWARESPDKTRDLDFSPRSPVPFGMPLPPGTKTLRTSLARNNNTSASGGVSPLNGILEKTRTASDGLFAGSLASGEPQSRSIGSLEDPISPPPPGKAQFHSTLASSHGIEEQNNQILFPSVLEKSQNEVPFQLIHGLSTSAENRDSNYGVESTEKNKKHSGEKT